MARQLRQSYLDSCFAKAGANFHILAASSGVGPVHVGRKFGFARPLLMFVRSSAIPPAIRWSLLRVTIVMRLLSRRNC